MKVWDRARIELGLFCYALLTKVLIIRYPPYFTKYSNVFQTVYSQPSIVFMFCQTDLHDDPVRVPSPSDGHRGRSRLPRASKRKKAEIGLYVKSLLPKDCELVGMTTDGIVGKFNP